MTHDELAEMLRVHVMRLSALNTGLSSMAWSTISNDILEAAARLSAFEARAEAAEGARTMTDKKQESMEFFSKAYDAASEMEPDGVTICWVARDKTLVHWRLTGDIEQHARAYVSMAGMAILERLNND